MKILALNQDRRWWINYEESLVIDNNKVAREFKNVLNNNNTIIVEQ